MDSTSPDSYWNITLGETDVRYEPLNHDMTADVAVIGAGITGLTAAMHLKQAGRTVIVLEAGRVGGGTTGGTSAHLDFLPESGAQRLIANFGEKAARLLVDARREAIDRIESWSSQFGFDCEFKRVPGIVYTEDSSRRASIEQECQAMNRLGIIARMDQHLGLPFPYACGFIVDNQARFHAMKYVFGLARQVDGDGCRVCEHSRAELPSGNGPFQIKTNGRTVTASEVIVATHSPYMGISQLDVRVAPYRSYMVAVHVEESTLDALYSDDAQPYRYTRWASSDTPRLLLIGGADHKCGHGDEQVQLNQLKDYVRERYRVKAFERTWSAELFEPADSAPLVGRTPLHKHMYCATGFAGIGLTYGTASGKLIADLIQGEEPAIAAIVSPSRFKPLAGGAKLLKENLDVAKSFVGDRFAAERIESLDEIEPGTGTIVYLDGKQLAAYRDESGDLTLLSPKCTHAGCYVHWNSLENVWDCPCHGGCFSPRGERLYGPPARDLALHQPHATKPR